MIFTSCNNQLIHLYKAVIKLHHRFCGKAHWYSITPFISFEMYLHSLVYILGRAVSAKYFLDGTISWLPVFQWVQWTTNWGRPSKTIIPVTFPVILVAFGNHVVSSATLPDRHIIFCSSTTVPLYSCFADIISHHRSCYCSIACDDYFQIAESFFLSIPLLLTSMLCVLLIHDIARYMWQ